MKRMFVLLAAVLALAAGTAAAATQPKLPFAGAVHAVGTITYLDGAQKTWNWDRGRITALSDTSITLTRRDRNQVTFAITASTLVRNAGASYTLGDLKAGLAATVISQDGNAVIIRNLRGEGAPSGADQSAIEGPGKGSVTGSIDALYVGGSSETFQYDRGRITALSAGSVTILRQDKQSLTFSYDPSVPVWAKGHLEDASALQVGQGGLFFSQDGKLAVVHGLFTPKAKPASAQASTS
ncbi:MAG TPA: DUF5666 domain-containing protein [Gaiellaceae bacterium]|nr:DUF5666 domain-containing protein [Gaiellaceae bacterium]